MKLNNGMLMERLNVFIKKGELLQIPLLFVLMTKRRYADYKAVGRMTKDNFVEWYIKIPKAYLMVSNSLTLES